MQSFLTVASFIRVGRLQYTGTVTAITAPTLYSKLSRRADADADKDASTTLAVPIVAEPSQHWEGVDGIWSTFIIRVGTPESTYRVLPVTSWQETWVVYGPAAGICNATAGVKKGCQEARGGAFDVSKSKTWKDGGQHQLGLDEDLGMRGVGQYGFDKVGLGYTNSTGPTLSNQIVSAIVSDDYWFGILGLGFQPTNFSGYNDPQASFSETLYASGEISSRSWSYTAGAYYRLKSVFGSLIFGGYDASRFTPNNVTFTMTGDNLRDVVVTLRTITWATRIGPEHTLMSDAEFAFIDSAVPELWLPISVCEQFEKAFGLQYDDASARYLLDDSSHMKLKEANPSFTITLANQKDGGPTTDIILPYAAFDLNITAPILENRTEWYFPIRRGTAGEYTLGRVFLQEAYVTTHYPSRTFNISQCVFEDGTPEHIIALPDNLPSNKSQSHSGSGLGPGSNKSGFRHKKIGAGAIAGIVIGVLALFLGLGLLLFFWRRRRHQKEEQRHPQTLPRKDERQEPLTFDLPNDAVEIDPGKRLEGPGKWNSGHGEQATSFTNEVPGQDAKVELDGNPIMVPQELEAEVPVAADNTVLGQSNTAMAELVRAESGLRKGGGADSREKEGEGLVSPVTDRERNSIADTADGAGTRDSNVSNTSTAAAAAAAAAIGTGESHRRGSHKARPSILVSTPSGNEGTWSPMSPVQRTSTRGSRFQEQLD